MSSHAAKAFSAYLAEQNGMMLNAAESFSAGWDAGMYCMMDLLEVPSNKEAPAEAATSDQRNTNITNYSIPSREGQSQ